MRRSILSSVSFSEKYTRNKSHVNVGVIGHKTHGKTTLTSAITKYLSKKGRCEFYRRHDLLKTPEERAKGFTINNSVLEYETDKRHFCHIDSPGRPDYGKNTILGTSQLDIGILVVDNNGIEIQTREHVLIAKYLGVKKLVVYMSKADLVTDMADLEIMGLDVKDMVAKYGYDYDSTPLILGSAQSALENVNPDIGEGSIKELIEKLETIELPPRDLKSPFLLQLFHLATVTVTLYKSQCRGKERVVQVL
jgi:elongation factor Tu